MEAKPHGPFLWQADKQTIVDLDEGIQTDMGLCMATDDPEKFFKLVADETKVIYQIRSCSEEIMRVNYRNKK